MKYPDDPASDAIFPKVLPYDKALDVMHTHLERSRINQNDSYAELQRMAKDYLTMLQALQKSYPDWRTQQLIEYVTAGIIKAENP